MTDDRKPETSPTAPTPDDAAASGSPALAAAPGKPADDLASAGTAAAEHTHAASGSQTTPAAPPSPPVSGIETEETPSPSLAAASLAAEHAAPPTATSTIDPAASGSQTTPAALPSPLVSGIETKETPSPSLATDHAAAPTATSTVDHAASGSQTTPAVPPNPPVSGLETKETPFPSGPLAPPSPPVSGIETRETPSPATGDETTPPPIERRLQERRVGDRRMGTAPPVEVDDDGWPLESLDGLSAPAEPVMPVPHPTGPLPQMPSPASAAYEAARIVGEMVGDIESAPGAALVAAAAAGAAIEVARARMAAGEPDRSLASSVSAADAASTDPAVSERMHRDRILRALAEDIAATATSTATAESVAAGAAATAAGAGATPGRASSQSGAPVARGEPMRTPHTGHPTIQRARSEDAGTSGSSEAADPADDELDPVAIAAAAIARLRERARTDLAELRVHYHRHDILVLLVAFVIIVVAGRVHQGLVTPPTEAFDPGGEHGLSFQHSRGWLTSPGGPLPPPRIAHEVASPSTKPSSTLYRVELTSTTDPTARIEVMIDKKPAWSNIVTGLDLDRRTRWGELYSLDDSSVRSVEDHQWLRTAYRFAHAQDKGDAPRIDRAVEYATIDREQIYVLTFFGTTSEIERIEEVVAPTLRVATQTGLPLVPQTGHLSTRQYPNAVARAFDSTVMVVVADIVDGKLRARGGGSGVIVGRDGSVLTNYHVIHDQNGRLHDVFVIGRFSEQDKAPQLHCAGKPSRSKLQRELDLALLKCDLDLDGRTWNPSSSAGTWPTLPQTRSADIKIGQRIWVLGYPDVGGGGLTLSEGEVEGWSGVDGTTGRDFLKTDAAIRHGNSGGPVVDDAGHLVGIASAVRTKQTAAGDIVEIVQAGGRIRPIAAATDLLAIAAAGWTPREGRTEVELQPSAIEVPAEGVQIQSRVLDVANEAPVRDALVMVLRPGVNAATVDVNRLDDQVLAYGRSNAQGEVLLKQPVPVPGTYTLMVVARGYEPVVGENELTLEANTPAVFDPWGKLLLRAR